MKHGILSNAKLFPWESSEEYQALHQGFINDYFPEGESEKQLVEELTDIIWRKRRLKQAQKSSASKKMYRLIKEQSYGDITALDATFTLEAEVPYLSDQKSAMQEMLNITEQEVKNESSSLAKEYKQLEKVIDRLTIELNMEYQEMLEILPAHISDLWQQAIDREGRNPNGEALIYFLEHTVLPKLKTRLTLLNHHQMIKEQVFGEVYCHEAMRQMLIRYEQFLDKKFEKALTMLIKLKELRPQLVGLKQDHLENSES